MDNSEKKMFFDNGRFSCYITKDQVELIRENLTELFDDNVDFQPGKAFMHLVEKALSRVKIKSDPADLAKINELTSTIEQLKADLLISQNALFERDTIHKNVSAQFNDLVESNNHLKSKYESLLAELEALKANPGTTEVEKELLPTQRLLNLTPFESFVLKQIEDVHKTDARGILIERFFNVYQQRGMCDFDIKRISPAKYREIFEHFKAQAQ